MNNLPKYIKIFLILLFSIPYIAVFLNYTVMAFNNDSYLAHSNNLIYSWLEDSTYLLIAQLIPRLFILFFSMILNQILFNFFSINNRYYKRVISSTITGFALGILMLFANVVLFREHKYSNIEPILCYTIIGHLYGRYIYAQVDTLLENT